MKQIALFLISILALVSCTNSKNFKVEGVITNASNKTLLLEASRLQGIVPLDSVKLNEKGNYSFKIEAPQSPEFYRLRIGSKLVNFSIDSTEVVTIDGDFNDLSTKYIVEGSANSLKIKELVLKQIELQRQTDKLLADAHQGLISNKQLQQTLEKLYGDYKDDIKRNYVLIAPNTTAAYYALFPKINGYMLFDPLNNKDDLRCFAAVATSFTDKYPHSDRAKNLYNTVIKGMRNNRRAASTGNDIVIPEEKIKTTGIIDIDLRGSNGRLYKLSDLTGKVVLLDFNVFQSPVSAAHIFALRELYDKYAKKGLEIYQISLDADEHFWRMAVDNLPWICVRDEMGIYSQYATVYNIQQVPTYFLVNRQNELVGRSENIKDIDKAIKELL